MLVVLALVFGLADGFVIPTSQGLIPAVVSAVRLQQANALLGLSRSILGVLGPAARRRARRVRAARAARCSSTPRASAPPRCCCCACAIPKRDDSVEPEPFLAELREGWNEFRRQTLDLDDDRLLRDRQLRVDVACSCSARSSRRSTTRARRTWAIADQRVRGRHDPRRARRAPLAAVRGRCSSRASPRCRSRSQPFALGVRAAGRRARRDRRRRRDRARDPPRALVHRLPAARARGSPARASAPTTRSARSC